MEELSDRDVLLRSRVDPSRFATIFDRHAAAIHRFAGNRVGAAGADDIVADAFRIAFERRTKFDGTTESALPWLYGIALNLVRHELRRRSRQRSALGRVARRHDVVWLDDDRAGPIDASSDLANLRHSLRSLPAHELEVLLLVAWEQLSPTDVAAVLGIPATTARSRLHRARQHIRRQLLLPSSRREH